VRTPLFRRVKRGGTILSIVLLSSFLLAACGENSPSILNTTGPVAGSEAGLFWFTLVVATIVFVLVEGWLIVAIIRYRARPNSPEPRQIHGNNTLELVWTIIPAFFLFVVLIATIYTMFTLQTFASSKGNLTVTVVGHQWWWEFDYPNQHIVTADTLVIPQGYTVTTNLVSDNVIHSFWIPSITGKTDVIPGHLNQKLFQADQLGTYRGECAEFCGVQHAHMNFTVTVVAPDQFNKWITAQQQLAQTPTAPLALQGKTLFNGAGTCSGCHGIVGNNLKSFDDPIAQYLKGPNLTHFGSRSLIAGGVLLTSDPKYTWATDPNCALVNGQLANKNSCALYQWLHDPQGIKPGNDMIIPNLTDDQIYALIAYLEYLQ
jgi:cytochrome c oxidase subunit II